MIGVMVTTDPLWTEMVSGKIDEFPPNVQCSQVKKVPGRLYLNLGECLVEPQHAVLENVGGFFPPPQIPGTMKNLPGEPPQTVTGVIEQCLHRGWIAGICPVDQPLECRVGTSSCPSHGAPCEKSPVWGFQEATGCRRRVKGPLEALRKRAEKGDRGWGVPFQAWLS
jgi:hypothetical protein